MKLLVATLAATLFAGASAIYPGDHWQFATKLNNGIVDEFVKENVDAGKTVFIRWIASPG
jgi:hypothetical protein